MAGGHESLCEDRTERSRNVDELVSIARLEAVIETAGGAQ